MGPQPCVTTNSKSVVSLLNAYIDALNAHSVDRVIACVAEDFFNEHTSAMGVSVRGRHRYAEALAQFFAEFPNLSYEIEDVLVDGARAALPYAFHATISGTPVRIRGIFRFQIAHGMITHRVDYWDSSDVTRQIAAGKSAGNDHP